MRSYSTYLVAAILVGALATAAQAQDSPAPKAQVKPTNDPMRTTITDPAQTTFGGALFTDVKQGKNTCWIDGSLAALAFSGKDPSRLIHYQGDHWYTVALFNVNNKDNRATGGYHRITERVFFDGTRTDGDPRFDPLQPGESWVVIVHRAVVQAVAQWDPSQNIKTPHSGSPADALGILTGHRPQAVEFQDSKVEQKVAAALATRKTIVICTNDKTKALVANHCYAVLASDSQGLSLYNPWGSVTSVSWQALRQEKGGSFYIL
jgi:hypothetical protein